MYGWRFVPWLGHVMVACRRVRELRSFRKGWFIKDDVPGERGRVIGTGLDASETLWMVGGWPVSSRSQEE